MLGNHSITDLVHTQCIGRNTLLAHIKQMKLFTSITIAGIIGFSTTSILPVKANQFRYCEPGTRCTEYSVCFINQVKQPCAYGSGGAVYGGIIFDHGYFSVEWLSNQTGRVTYGKDQEFKSNAQISVENGFRVFRLSDGTTVKYPTSGGRRNPSGGAAPTHRPLVR